MQELQISERSKARKSMRLYLFDGSCKRMPGGKLHGLRKGQAGDKQTALENQETEENGMMEKLMTIFVIILMFELVVSLAGLAFAALSWAIDELADKIKKRRGK